MGNPAVLLILQDRYGFFLYRFTKSGHDAGDTWHRNIEEAQEQARYEYGDLVGDWMIIPSSADDAVAFAIKQVS